MDEEATHKFKIELDKLFDEKLLEFQDYYEKFETHRANDNFQKIKSDLGIGELLKLKKEFKNIENYFNELTIIIDKKLTDIRDCNNQLSKLFEIRDNILSIPIVKDSYITINQNHYGTGDNIGRNKL